MTTKKNIYSLTVFVCCMWTSLWSLTGRAGKKQNNPSGPIASAFHDVLQLHWSKVGWTYANGSVEAAECLLSSYRINMSA